MIVEAPDGKTIDFGDLPQEQVQSAMQKMYPTENKQQSTLLDTAKNSLNSRMETAKNAPDLANFMLSSARIGVGVPADVAGEALNRVTPDIVKQGLGHIGQGISNLPFAGHTVGEAANAFAKEYPTATNALGYAAEAGFPKVGKVAATEATIAARKAAGSKAKSMLENLSTEERRIKEAQARKDVLPDLSTPEGVAEAGKNVTHMPSIIGKGSLEVNPNDFQKDMISNLAKVEGYSPKNLHKVNELAVDKHVADLSASVEKQLTDEGVSTIGVLPSGQEYNRLVAKLDPVAQSISENETLIGNANRVGSSIVSKAKELIGKDGKTLAGAYRARKELDKFIQGKKKEFPRDQDAIGVASDKIRSAMNDFIADNSKKVDYRGHMREMNTLLEAKKKIGELAAAQPPTAIGRLAKGVKDVASGKTQLMTASALFGLGKAAAAGAGVLAPSVGIPAALLYGGYKGVTSAPVRKAIAKGLEKIGTGEKYSKAISKPNTLLLESPDAIAARYPMPNTEPSLRESALQRYAKSLRENEIGASQVGLSPNASVEGVNLQGVPFKTGAVGEPLRLPSPDSPSGRALAGAGGAPSYVDLPSYRSMAERDLLGKSPENMNSWQAREYQRKIAEEAYIKKAIEEAKMAEMKAAQEKIMRDQMKPNIKAQIDKNKGADSAIAEALRKARKRSK